jgi:hypothetical protein
MPGLEAIPLRIPQQWDPVWFEQFVREVLALADVRNAQPGPGISITGQPNEPATIKGIVDLEEIADADFVVLSTSPQMPNARVLAGEPDTILIEDGGPGGQARVVVQDHSIGDTKIRQGHRCSVIGRAENSFGPVSDIEARENGHVLQRASDALMFAALTRDMIPMTGPGKLLGRFSAGPGGAQEITIGANLTLDGNTLNATGGTPTAADVSYSPTDPLTATNVQAALDQLAALLAIGGGVVLGVIIRLVGLSPLWTMAVTLAGNPNDGLRSFTEIAFV